MNNRISLIDDLDALLGLTPFDTSAGPGPDETAAIIHYLVGPGDTRDYNYDCPLPHTLQVGRSVLGDIIEDNIDLLEELLAADAADTPGAADTARRCARRTLLEQRRQLLEWVKGHPEVNVRLTLTLPVGERGRRR
jgi:hypothetical protein